MTMRPSNNIITTGAVSPTLVNLHAKLLLGDAALDELHETLEDEADCQWYLVDIDRNLLTPAEYPNNDARINVLIRRRPAGTPAWKPFLSGLSLPISTAAGPNAESVLVVVRCDSEVTRTLLWCFGTASLAIPNELVDGRFGLIVALNKHVGRDSIGAWRELPDKARRRHRTGDPAELVRQLQADVRDGHRHTVMAKSPSASPVQGLGFDTVSDLLRGLRVLTTDDLMPDLEGGRGLKFATYLDQWRDFGILADYLVDLRGRLDYRKEWDWVDHVVPVAPRVEVNRLLGVLYNVIQSDEDAAVDLVLPEIQEDDDVTARKLLFGMGHEDAMRRPVDWRLVRRRLCSLTPAVRPLHRSLKLKPEGAPNTATQTFSLVDLLVAEFNEDGRRYLLGDGELLTVDVDFLARLDARLKRITWSEFPFPLYQGGTERAYLEQAAKSLDRLALLDLRNIVVPGETPFEPCDLLSDDRRMIFAKLKGRSSPFSHLCAQAESAAEMLLRHEYARAEFLDKVAASGASTEIEEAAIDSMAALEDRQPDVVTVTLLLLGSWKNRDLSSLPLLSRLRLRRTADRVTDLGYKFEVASPMLVVPEQCGGSAGRKKTV